MKVLRILRRRKIRLSFVFLLLLVFIVNTYAWISYSRETEAGGLTANVTSWSVEFIIDGEEELTNEYTFEIDEFHPGIAGPIEKKIQVYNIGEAASVIDYRIKDIYLYGKQIVKNGATEEDQIPETVGTEQAVADGYTANVFGNSSATIFDATNTYGFTLRYPTPFTISYTYDKKNISGSDGSIDSRGEMTLNLAWYNNDANDVEDTKIGNLAYDYKVSNPDEPALKITVEVEARRDM